MDFGIIAMVALAVLGILMLFAPKLCTRSDKRDDPDAIAQIRKCGIALVAFVIAGALYLLKLKAR